MHVTVYYSIGSGDNWGRLAAGFHAGARVLEPPRRGEGMAQEGNLRRPLYRDLRIQPQSVNFTSASATGGGSEVSYLFPAVIGVVFHARVDVVYTASVQH